MCTCKRTVLIVDNREQGRRLLQRRLERMGYHVITAENAGVALEKAKTELIHLAIIDVRLEDDLRIDDYSGIHLFAALSIERKILMTAWDWPDPERLLRSVFEVRYLDYVKYWDFIDGKRYMPQEILKSIDRAFSKAPVINMGLELKLESGLSWETMVKQMKLSNGHGDKANSNGKNAGFDPVQMLQHVSCLLFSSSERRRPNLVRFMSTTPGFSPCTVAMVRPYLQRGPGMDLAVKFGPIESIQREYNNFEEYVLPYIPNHSRTHLEYGPVYLEDIGALAYDFMGQNIKSINTLADYYNNAQVTEEELCKTITHLFKDTCKRWYELRDVVSNNKRQRLDTLYRSQLNLLKPLQVNKTKKAFHSLLGRSRGSSVFKLRSEGFLEVELKGKPNSEAQKLRLPDPVKFCFETRNSSGRGTTHPHRNFFPLVDQYAITHGDLHAGNVIVNKQGGAWLLDFYKTGIGHALRDFAELESHIRFFLFDGNLSARYELERALLRPNRLTEPLFIEKSSPAQQRALSAIQTLRQVAYELTDIESSREYYMALLFYALKGIRGFTSGSIDEQSYIPAKTHALLSAALLCQRLSSTSANKRGALFVAHDYHQSYRKLMYLKVAAHIRRLEFDAVHPLDNLGGNIWLGVAQMIEDTDGGLYEISTGNGNVYFELGYAVGNRKPYFALIDRKSKLKRPPLIGGDLLYEYSGERTLKEHVKRILDAKDKWEDRFFYLKPAFKTKVAQVKEKSRSAALLVANTPRQKKELEPLFKKILTQIHQRTVDIIPVEQQVNVEDFVLRLCKAQVVIGCLASDRSAGSRDANAELTLALGIAKGLGKRTIILQEKDCKVLTDLRSLTITFRGLPQAAEALETELKKLFPASRGQNKTKHPAARAKKGRIR